MAKSFVRISLSTKLRILFAGAGLAIIIAALAGPWYFTERLTEQAAAQSAAEISAIALQQWEEGKITGENKLPITRYFSSRGKGRRGPIFIAVTENPTSSMDPSIKQAIQTFRTDRRRKIIIFTEEDNRGKKVYRCFRAVRAKMSPPYVHGIADYTTVEPGKLIGLIDLTIPPPTGSLIWWTRGMFILGAILSTITAVITFSIITGRFVLSPVKKLYNLSEKVAEGNLAERCEISTGDEFEMLARRFNEMLDVITTLQDQLRRASRALDIRLRELTQANIALYQIDRIKNEFLANVSHELRTPLNSIIGFTELLMQTDDEKRRRYAENILTSARMLQSIINEMLTSAKIAAGKEQVNIEKVSITDLCETLVQLVRPMADKKHLELITEFADDIPIIQSDPQKVQQILYNLISNAIKFTPAGGKVTISARRVDSTVSPLKTDSVAVSVSDTGPGIPLADQERIFEKFSRLDNPMTREHDGAGLGLAISRSLATLLKGKITLQSEPGHGATFTITLPITPADKE